MSKTVFKQIPIFLLLLCFFAWPGKAQNTTHYFKNYQVANGLSSNTITSITQDHKGFMWFGSRNGLSRFDGNMFRVFRNNPADSSSLGSNSILSLHEDLSQKLWVGTYKGIYIYNPEKESFTPFKGIPQGEVRYIEEDKSRNLWIVSDLVLYRYNSLSQRLTQFKFGNDPVVSIHAGSTGTLWVAMGSGILKRFDLKQGGFINYKLAAYNHGMTLSAVQNLHAIGDSTLLVGTMNQVYVFNFVSKVLKNAINFSEHVADIHTHAIFSKNPQQYWLGTESGLYILDLKTGKVTTIQKQATNPYSITDNVISSIYKDAEGGIWVGSYFGGLNYYSDQYNNIQKYFQEPGINSINGNIIHEICQDKYGKLWIGTEDAGLNMLDLKSGIFRHFSADGNRGSISYRNIHGLLAVQDELWIGTYEHGLDVMSLKTKKIIRHYKAATNGRSFTSDFIVTLYKRRNGDILVGTWNGLFKYNRSSNDFSPLRFFTAHIQNIHEDEQGTLWVSTYGSGVYYENSVTGKRGHFQYQAGQANGLVNNYVNSLFEDQRHQLWFSTENGLSMYSPRTGKFSNYTTARGLPDNQVFRVLEDDRRTLWISTSNGLSRFDAISKQFTNYHTSNGLPTEQFNYNSSWKASNGALYFGTVKGMISIRPSAFVLNKYVPPVYFTGFQIDNKEVLPATEKNILAKTINSTKSTVLPYNSSNISFDVAALSYVAPERNAYAYKMDGLDKIWTVLKNNRRIYYTKLPPGQYVLRIRGSNSEGVWNTKETTLRITVLPPYWATWWAYSIYSLIALGIMILIFWYYHLALQEKNKRLIGIIEINTEREIYNAKIDFFTNIAHEIRTPLTLIKMPLDKLINQNIKDVVIADNLNMMRKNTNRLIELTNQLLDFRKAEANKLTLSFSKTDINELLLETFNIFKPAAEQKQIGYKIELPRIGLQAYVDTEALRKILSNLFSNAIKYAGHSVLIKLLPFSSEDHNFNIEIRNDGVIVPDEFKERIFEPFFRLKETEREAGTGIGLSLSRSLVQLHKGSLTVKTPDAAINIFLLSLPIHQETESNLNTAEDDKDQQDLSSELQISTEGDKPRLLLVEDNKDILNYIHNELVGFYRVFKASNGLEALEILQKENIKLVVSDIMMPLLNGIELCKKMKTDLQYSHIPIILLTAKNTLESKIEGLEVGADAYIEKPFSFEHLLAQINSLVNNRNIIQDYFARTPLTHIKGMACSKADKDFLEQLNQKISENITNMELDVEQLSAMMNMSRPTLYRKIKALSDLTPNELINISRLKKGAELLAEGGLKVNEVANLIGYSMPTNFSRDFQKQFGVSPSSYVNELKR